MIKYCIFDLDGTLLNTINDLASACNRALAANGFNTHETDKYRYFVGNGVQKLVERALPEGYTAEDYTKVKKAFDEIYNAHFMDETKPYNGILPLLESLKNKGVTVAVVSNKPDEFSKPLIKQNFGEDTFSFVLGAVEGMPKKPAPDGVERCIKFFGAQKDECVYIGDSDVDILTAKNAGLVSIGAEWGFRGYCELAEAGADYIAEEPKDVEYYIKKINTPPEDTVRLVMGPKWTL